MKLKEEKMKLSSTLILIFGLAALISSIVVGDCKDETKATIQVDKKFESVVREYVKTLERMDSK